MGAVIGHQYPSIPTSTLLLTTAVAGVGGTSPSATRFIGGVSSKTTVSMGAILGKGVKYTADGEIESCLFCNICAGKQRQTEVAYEDDRVVVFAPLGPLAEQVG